MVPDAFSRLVAYSRKVSSLTQFGNGLISAILECMGVKHVLTLAYSKEDNGRVERANREVLRHLRAFVNHSKVVVDDWVRKLPMVQRIMNSSVHSVTGFTPAAMLFGTAVDLNHGILPVVPEDSSASAAPSCLWRG